MRRVSVVTQQISQSHEDLLDMNENFNRCHQMISLFPPEESLAGGGLAQSKSFSSFWSSNQSSPLRMTSRPSFISLMLIASDDELSRLPRLPAPLQVESDTFQKCGWEDAPKFCSHLPILHQPDSEEECEPHSGILQSIIHLPEKMRKISADKQRFNVYALPDQDREQLKNMYVY